MQKQKTEKISIFSSLDVKLKFLMNRVELTQFSVESSHVKLKIWAIQLKSSWKCEQLDFESSRIQNVNSKLNLMISLRKTRLSRSIILINTRLNSLKKSLADAEIDTWIAYEFHMICVSFNSHFLENSKVDESKFLQLLVR